MNHTSVTPSPYVFIPLTSTSPFRLLPNYCLLPHASRLLVLPCIFTLHI